MALAWGSGGRDADPRFVEAMGGDKLLQEARWSGNQGGLMGRIGTFKPRARVGTWTWIAKLQQR